MLGSVGEAGENQRGWTGIAPEPAEFSPGGFLSRSSGHGSTLYRLPIYRQPDEFRRPNMKTPLRSHPRYGSSVFVPFPGRMRSSAAVASRTEMVACALVHE